MLYDMSTKSLASSHHSKAKSDQKGQSQHAVVIGDGSSLKHRLDFLQARDMSDENIKKVTHIEEADKENNQNRNRSKSANK